MIACSLVLFPEIYLMPSTQWVNTELILLIKWMLLCHSKNRKQVFAQIYSDILKLSHYMKGVMGF